MKNITMKSFIMKLIAGLLLSVLYIPVWAQNQNDNLTKYWKYRERLRNRFMVVSENVERYGVNIPAAFIDYDLDTINWGDANSNMSHYLSVLATELWLLKNNNQDYSTTLKELYYAMLAMERLDTYSEYSLRYRENIGYYIGNTWVRGFVDQGNDINGFHLRDDVSDGFWSIYNGHFDVPHYYSNFKNENMYECSQDVIYHNMEGLALVRRLVATESVSGIPVTFVNSYIPDRLTNLGIKNGTAINFSLWAQNFIQRYIGYMQNSGTYSETIAGIGLNTHWFLINPITQTLVRDGNGDDFDTGGFYHYGVIKTGIANTGQNLRVYGGLLTSAGTEDFYNDLFRRHAVKAPPVFGTVSILVDLLFGGIYINIPFDDYKLRSLSCNGNVLGTETFSILRNHRDNYDPKNTGNFPIYEHFPLMYLTLHELDYSYTVMSPDDNIYNSDKVLYETLLNSAPICGPASNCGIYDWTSRSRCVWPEHLVSVPTGNVEYAGLDYMMLHNLYYIAFRKEDFKKLTIDASSIYRSNSASSGIIEVNTSITGNNITYTASNSIKFTSGFNISGGKVFKARILHRSNNYQGDAYKTLSATDCVSSLKSAFVSTIDDAQLNNTLQFIEPVQREANKTNILEDLDLKDSGISIFPNPSNGVLTLSSNSIVLPIQFDVVNLDGIIVHKGSIESSPQKINLSFLSRGIYMFRFHAKDRMYTKKVILTL